jgi:fatty acid desaturase
MTLDFAKPKLSVDQKKRIKKLYARNNYRGFLAILSDYGWIAFACWLSLAVHPAFYIPTILLIGARQRALASLLREAAHGTLLRSKILNISVGRILCGWPILQSFDTYRTSHVLAHHPKIGDLKEDPDYQYMKDCGIYEPQSRTKFINRFVVSPLFGSLTPRYVRFLIRDRFMSALMRRSERREAMAIIAFHLAICIFASWGGWLLELALYWWVPFILVYPIIGWFSELSEHYPLMEQASGKQYFSRNRYAGWLERLFIGMHGDHLASDASSAARNSPLESIVGHADFARRPCLSCVGRLLGWDFFV